MIKTTADYTEKNILAVTKKFRELLASVERPGMDKLIENLYSQTFKQGM